MALERREVSSEEFSLAYNNEDNRRIIGSILRRYRGVLNDDDLESCGMEAMWKALRGHRAERGGKFTSSLYRFVVWACQHAFRRVYGDTRSSKYKKLSFVQLDFVDEEPTAPVTSESQELLRHVEECMELIEPWMKEIIHDRFFEHMSYVQIGKKYRYSKERAYRRVRLALAKLKAVCKV